MTREKIHKDINLVGSINKADAIDRVLSYVTDDIDALLVDIKYTKNYELVIRKIEQLRNQYDTERIRHRFIKIT